MTLHLSAAVASRGFDVELELAPGETLAVLGPNGAGKSTLLGVLAGLLRPDRGEAGLGGRTLFRLHPGTPPSWLPPHRRGVTLLTQQPLLFPHLTALDNVAFAPRSAGRSQAESRRDASSWLSAVDALELADRRPALLSGGQAQRVAVARALAAEPRLLLLDEPMAALDVSVASALRRTLRCVLGERSTIIVTHDALDALTLADRVIVLHEGRIVEQGTARAVFEQPRTAFTAELAGLVVIEGETDAHGFVTVDGTRLRSAGPLPVPGPALGAYRPAQASLARPGERGPLGEHAVGVTVTALEAHGDLVRVHAGALRADLGPLEAARLDPAPGDELLFSLPSSELRVYSS